MRKVNLEALSEESFEELIAQMGSEVNLKLNKVKEEVDGILAKFGLKLELSAEIRLIEPTKE